VNYTIPIEGIRVDDISDLPDASDDFMNAFNNLLGGNSGDLIYGVTFVDNNFNGVDVVYSIDLALQLVTTNDGFDTALEISIKAEPGLEPLFGKFYNLKSYCCSSKSQFSISPKF
jgi:hypothetical protein